MGIELVIISTSTDRLLLPRLTEAWALAVIYMFPIVIGLFADGPCESDKSVPHTHSGYCLCT
jgi:hypothetical protein